MIKSGRREGWLSLPPHTFKSWTQLNDIELNGIKFAEVSGRGTGVIASRSFKSKDELRRGSVELDKLMTYVPLYEPEMLMKVPQDMVLSKETVRRWAAHDARFKELLNACPELIERKARGWILLFLLYQVTSCNPSTQLPCSRNPFMDYIKFLPEVSLPTFWSREEQKLLAGTTLLPALNAKLDSLKREFEILHSGTANIPWCADNWWIPEARYWSGTALTFEDWLHLDAAYRSRALEMPNIGDVMVPALDMANHASEEDITARYDVDADGNVMLVMKEEKTGAEGDEIFITYGEKGACEMLFSYGFLESSRTTASELFLDLSIPDDDPLKFVKKTVATCAPRVRIFDSETEHRDGGRKDETQWESDYVWWSCVNEEDGLEFRVLQQTDGERELAVIWKGARVEDPNMIGQHLKEDELRELFELRAVVMVQERVEAQLIKLKENGPSDATDDTEIRPEVKASITRLRELEGELLERAHADLEHQKLRLANSDTVEHFLSNQAQQAAAQTVETVNDEEEDDDTEDFS
ncbi:SET domain-containing protein [Eremomyces bilateralis CBS 781.70]|uniref:SET domain-containing protein n=1 Tax=Eremomyces bilateralis CBS 781.70 TaxID=1392243 RepID=A0A6G1GBS2_9PEZI|nr:SET domain-containing protein [Eremomyces bilateralis CBS 781.70]KAF1815537.1 SET domain-containing protein [Eremomyces bilateralis CBS 781.70]